MEEIPAHGVIAGTGSAGGHSDDYLTQRRAWFGSPRLKILRAFFSGARLGWRFGSSPHFFSHSFPGWKQHRSAPGRRVKAARLVRAAPAGGASAESLDAAPALRTLPAGKNGSFTWSFACSLNPPTPPRLTLLYSNLGCCCSYPPRGGVSPPSPCEAWQKLSPPESKLGNTKTLPAPCRYCHADGVGKRRITTAKRQVRIGGLTPRTKAGNRDHKQAANGSAAAPRIGRRGGPRWDRKPKPAAKEKITLAQKTPG